MRFILGFIAFTVTFGLSASLVGLLFGFPQPTAKSFAKHHSHNSATTRKIERLLKRDVARGDVRDISRARLEFELGSDEALLKSSAYQMAVKSYHRDSSNMNDSNLPADFRYAWRNHMKEWGKQTAYLKSIQNSEFDVEDSPSFGLKYDDNTREINRTWDQVLRIAQRYGVRNVGRFR